jgi:preprotein translocase subunit SecD
MRNKIWRKVFLIFVITLAALYIATPDSIPLFGKVYTKQAIGGKQFPLILGLDLVGGSHLVFEADTSGLADDKKAEALQGLRDVIERRVNLFGVSEPNIQISSFEGKDRVIVELPGVKDTKQAIELVGQTAQLIFAEVITVGEGEEAQGQLTPTELTGADLKDANVTFDQVKSEPGVTIEFTEEGSKKFAELTKRNIGKQLPIVLDGQVVTAPVVQTEITTGPALISGQFTTEQAKQLAIQLNAGALPIPVQLIEQRTVGATLGSESVEKSIRAGLVGVGAVLLFMILMYRKLGFVANIGLIIFGILTFALYKLIPVVLTLPGIAGFLLSVGMAVDSNILIFERFKEERKIRVNIEDALENSFGRAWDSIRDANIATLITAFILANPLDWPFLHTSGPVRGFALTLALGIGISMFTGLYVSRNLLRLVIRHRKEPK